MNTPMKKRRFIVDEMIYPGLHVLSGDPKIGKSWMMMDMCLAIAKGEKFLGRKTEQGHVVYMALEDTSENLQTRMYELTDEPTDNLQYVLLVNTLGNGLEDDLRKYRIEYNTWFRESSLHNSDAIKNVIELLKKSGYTYEQEGALWFKSSELGDEKDRVLIRANGIPTYFVPDIAYHYNKLVTRGFDTAIDILGADHHGYIPRMKAAMQALGVDPNRLDMIIMQMVRLVKNGETYKLSKRSGKAVTLETLLDEIPIDAARFFFNLREANSHFEFDLDLAIEQSSKNPVYYVQYAHARICSIIRNLEAEGYSVKALSAEQLNVLDAPEEIELIRFIASLPNTVDAAAKDYDPAKITRYTQDLATLFHKFYDKCRIKGAEENVLYARLALCDAVKITLRNTLDMLKITCPEKM